MLFRTPSLLFIDPVYQSFHRPDRKYGPRLSFRTSDVSPSVHYDKSNQEYEWFSMCKSEIRKWGYHNISTWGNRRPLYKGLGVPTDFGVYTIWDICDTKKLDYWCYRWFTDPPFITSVIHIRRVSLLSTGYTLPYLSRSIVSWVLPCAKFWTLNKDLKGKLKKPDTNWYPLILVFFSLVFISSWWCVSKFLYYWSSPKKFPQVMC